MHCIHGDYPSEPPSSTSVPIAVVGLGWRGPGDATSVDNFLKMLEMGREAREAFHQGKWNHSAFYHPNSARKGTNNIAAGHYFKDDLSRFDAPFFRMTEAEAIALDPQQRLLLETCYEALENGGISLEEIAGSETSVFVGTFGNDYTDLLQKDPDSMPIYQATSSGYSRAIISNRLSHFFDLRSLSVTIDTACSGGLTAFHLACQSLRSGESRQAICGGSSVILHPDQFISLSALGFLSPDGRCYAFDERANGYARGEGVGCLFLKRLDDALANGDPIRAVVRMTGSNQDGKTPGISFPSKEAQMALIRSVYQKADLDPSETSYVEAHGTGTQVGDVIETSSLTEVIASYRPAEEPLIIGSVKTNIGHLEAASGIAALIKCVLMLEKKILFPNRNFVKPNSGIPLKKWNLKIPLVMEPWVTTGPHRLSINSCGYGGTNAHAILESSDGFLLNNPTFQNPRKTTAISTPCSDIVASTQQNSNSKVQSGVCLNHGNGQYYIPRALHNWRIFIISAFNESSVRRQAQNLAKYLGEKILLDQSFLNNLEYTLNARRSCFTYKCAIIAATAEDLIEQLEDEALPVFKALSPPKLAFVFTGQGSQWAEMGKELMDAYPEYARTIRRCRDHLKKIGASWDLLEELSKDTTSSRIGMAMFSHPLISALQIGLINLLRSWNIYPTAVTGHSSGEVAAAYAAGILNLEDTMTSAYYRGIISHRAATESPVKGGMMAVGLGVEEVQPYLQSLEHGYATIACENSPKSVTIAGDLSAIHELKTQLDKGGLFARKLLVEVGYHSRHMTMVEKEYRDSIANIKTNQGNGVEFFSSVTGRKMGHSELGPDYWIANMLGRVEFASAFSRLCHECDIDIVVEIGPHSALEGPINQILSSDSRLKERSIAYMTAMRRKQEAVKTAVVLATKLAARAVPLNLRAVNKSTGLERVLVDLPPYSWNKSKSYWAESRLSKQNRNCPYGRHDLLGRPEPNFTPFDARWRNFVRSSEIPWVKDHRIQSNAVYPAAGYISMAVEAIRQLATTDGIQIASFKLREISIGKALVLSENIEELETLFSMRPHSNGTRSSSEVWKEFFVYSVTENGQWTEHCRGMISVESTSNFCAEDDQTLLSPTAKIVAQDATAMKKDCRISINMGEFYQSLSKIGLDYGPTFANMTSAHAASGMCLARVTVPDIASVMPHRFQSSFVLHPALLDSVFHSIFAALTSPAASSEFLQDPFVPVFIESLYISSRLSTRPGYELEVYNWSEEKDSRQIRSSMMVIDPFHPSDIAIKIDGVWCTKLANYVAQQNLKDITNIAYNIHWEIDHTMMNLDSPSSIDSKGPTTSDEIILSQSLQSVLEHAKCLNIFGERSIEMCNIHEKLGSHFGLLGHQNPYLKVLELGAGAGLATRQIIESMCDDVDSVPRFGKWDIIHAGTRSFGERIDVLGKWKDMVEVKNFSLESLHLEQDLKPHTYDVVLGVSLSLQHSLVGAMVKTLSEVLKPGGLLLLLDSLPKSVGAVSTTSEASCPDLAHNSQDNDKFLAKRTHSDASVNSGYKTIFECQDALFTARKTHNPITVSPTILIIVSGNKENFLSHRLITHLIELNVEFAVCNLENADPTNKICVVLAELCYPFLYNPTEEQFKFAKEIFLRAKGVLWVTREALTGSPISNVVAGFSRTIRSETSGATIVNLDVDKEASEIEIANAISRLVSRCFLVEHNDVDILDTEYRLKDNLLMIPRLKPDVEIGQDVVSTTGESASVTIDRPFSQPDRSLRIEIGTPGVLDSIYFTDDEKITIELSKHGVEIEVRAVGCNYEDAMMALGQTPFDTLGAECSGVVTAIGCHVEGFSIGDRVCCVHFGSFCTSVRPDADLVQKLPDDMSFEVGASLPVAYMTAFYTVFQVAHVQIGETVLISDASEALGQALIQLCRMAGARILVTVRSTKEENFLVKNLEIPKEHIFWNQNGTFAEAIMKHTNSRGVDIVFNSLVGEGLRSAWNCIAPFGRFVELGRRNVLDNMHLEMSKFANNVAFTAVDLAALVRSRPKVARKVWNDVMQLVRQRAVMPSISTIVYSLAEVKQALQSIHSSQDIGKVIVAVQQNDIVKIKPPSIKQDLFKSNATYVLAGGLGGIGRAIAVWMVQNGARNLVFCNRSGDAKPEAKETMSLLGSYGASIAAYACDISDESQVRQVAQEVAGIMPPVRGIIQCAMVLRDKLFEYMTVDDFLSVVRPKVQGTINLHEVFPRDLDFFTMLSSISGIIGNESQAAYAGANSFMDAFAAFRNANGLPATTIDLGVVLDVGYVSKNEELRRAMARQGFNGTTEEEVLALLRASMKHPHRHSDRTQIVTGLGSWNPQTSLGSLSRPLFSHFRRKAQHIEDIDKERDSSSLRVALKDAKDLSDATSIICAALVSEIASLGMIAEESIKPAHSMNEYGIDSMIAVEMRNRIFREMDCTVAILELMADQSIQKLAATIARRTRLVDASILHDVE